MSWGPLFWYFLHTITYKYPEIPSAEYKKKYFYFFNYIVPSIIPCAKCQKHFLKQLRDKPIINSLNNKKELIIWLINIHNNINIKNKKKVFSIEEVDKIYSYNINKNEIYKLISFLKKKVQFGYLNIVWYNKFIYFTSIFL